MKGSTLLINSSVYWEGVLLTLYCVNCSYCKTELLYVVDRGLGPSVTYSVCGVLYELFDDCSLCDIMFVVC